MPRLHITAGSEATDGEQTYTFGAHPDGELTFVDGVAEVDDDVAAAVVDRYPNIERLEDRLETADADEDSESDEEPDGGAADTAEAPLNPAEYTIDELDDELSERDFSDEELQALRAAEQRGPDRAGAAEAIDSYLG